MPLLLPLRLPTPLHLRRHHLPGALILALWLPLVGCSGGRGETPVAKARPGDTLVRSGSELVVLEQPFKPGPANGLYKGIVVVSSPERGQRRLEVNGVCSMPGLQSEGWPAYDNLYGQRLPAAPGPNGKAAEQGRWQVLFHFDGRVEAGEATADQAWLARLRDNLCRRGSFDDRKR